MTSRQNINKNNNNNDGDKPQPGHPVCNATCLKNSQTHVFAYAYDHRHGAIITMGKSEGKKLLILMSPHLQWIWAQHPLHVSQCRQQKTENRIHGPCWRGTGSLYETWKRKQDGAKLGPPGQCLGTDLCTCVSAESYACKHGVSVLLRRS